MPLGDSITYGSSVAGGYRLPLYIALTNLGYNVDYVGSNTGNSAPGLGTEINHEGWGGWRISTSGDNGLLEHLPEWLPTYDDPDVILVHIGTNDSNDSDFANAINELDALVSYLATNRPYAHIIVTTLMKRGTDDTNANHVKIATQFNPFVPGLVTAQQALGRRVHFLDMFESVDRYPDGGLSSDQLHPDASGYAKMANAWRPVITNIVGHYGDHLPPGISSVRWSSSGTVVTFSKSIDLAASPAVTNPASYSLAPAGTVSAVSALAADLRKVTLSVSGLTPSIRSTLSFNGTVTDLVPASEGGPYTATAASATFDGPEGPKISSATLDGSSLTVAWSRALDIGASPAVTNPASWTLAPGGTVTAAALTANGLTNTLTVSGLAHNTTYTLTFTGIAGDKTPPEQGGPITVESASATFLSPAAAGFAAENLPPGALDGWDPLYTLNLPTGARYGRDPVPYALDNSAALAHIPIARVAYYMALQRVDEPLRYVWVECDAFTQDAVKLGVPTTASGSFFLQSVSNLTVATSSPNVTPGSWPTGNIEFWPCNYNASNGANVPGANGSAYDFGDTPTAGTYGSMQIHNTALGETLFAFNHWGSDSSSYHKPCLGIGNNPNPIKDSNTCHDWTFFENADQYPTRVLQVFIKRATAPVPHDPPVPTSAYLGFSGNQFAVTFSAPIAPGSVVPASFTLSDGVSVTDAKLARDQKTVTLTTAAPIASGLTLTVSGVRDLLTSTIAPAVSLSITDLPPQLAADVGAGAAAGYRVVYVLDIPATRSDFGGSAWAPYLFDQSAAIHPFDRVAYYLELGQRPLANPSREWVWTAMDAFTPYISKIGVPNVASKAVFQQLVTNLVVRSNKSTIIGGTFATGNIEFWPGNYTVANDLAIPGASGSYFDFGDGGKAVNAGHGSMQVHNYLNAQTVFAINRWGNNQTSPVGIGIGNCDGATQSPGGGANDKDWTHAANAAQWASRRLYVLARPGSTINPSHVALTPPAEVSANVPDVANFSLLYSIDIPAQCSFDTPAGRAAHYKVDNTATLLGCPYTRVGYYFELVKNNTTSYCWTAFDAITNDVRHLGVPSDDNVWFWQTVTNLDVKSNVAGVVNTNGCDTGNIEFWQRDYQGNNDHNIPGASGSAYDFGDRRGTSVGNLYGSMQVHNWGAQQTLWALNRFNKNSQGATVCVGIGNAPGTNPDWTHDNTGGTWDSRRLLVFVNAELPVPAMPATTPPEVYANVPDAAEYLHLYTYGIPVKGYFNNTASNNLYKSVNNSLVVSNFLAQQNLAVGRVGYYLELVKNNTTSYCWTAFDTFVKDVTLTRFDVPRWIYQQFIANLDVKSNVPGIVNTNGCDTGNIEFWHGNYGGAMSQGLPGGTTLIDFDDSYTTTSTGYGSMQVHNWGAKQTLWAINNFNNNATLCLGIGNNPDAASTTSGNPPQPDWTFTPNASSYSSRRLFCFIKPVRNGIPLTNVARPLPSRAIGQTSLNRALVFFNVPVTDDAAALSNFSADKGLAILDASMHPVYSNTCVILTTSPQTVGETYTLTVQAATARMTTANAMLGPRTVTFTAQTEASVRPDFLASIHEAADFKVAQKLVLNRTTYYAKGAPFALDETWPAAPAFDRVAYALDLVGTNGVRQWVWASMDPFTTDPLRVGLPTADRAARFQQIVSNLNVAVSASVTAVTPGSFGDGNIEFWPNNYNQANEANIPGASASAYDCGDRVDASVPVGHGCLQVHNYRLGQTILAVNSWGSDGRNLEMGIGNRTTGAPDWTQSGDAGYLPYSSRTLYVLVRPSAVPLAEPVPVPGWGTVPAIIIPPADILVDVGAAAFFAVHATGAERYQWRHNGVFIPGATASFLEITNARGRDVGQYDVLVYGTGSKYAVSLPARLAINSQGSILMLK